MYDNAGASTEVIAGVVVVAVEASDAGADDVLAGVVDVLPPPQPTSSPVATTTPTERNTP